MVREVSAAIPLVVLMLSTALDVGAQSPMTLEASGAQSIIRGCSEHATARGQSHAIAVVDAGGSLVAFLKMDGNTPGVAEFALRKAEAVAHWRFPTADMLNAAETTPGFEEAPRVVTVAGGVPILSPDGTDFLGAVGVSGEAPNDDVECAVAGITVAGLRSQRN
jgi:uncharacterized protein GlcG (DUF336 family)